MSHAGRFRVAGVCALTQWVLALTIQLGNLFGYLLPSGKDWEASAALFTHIPLVQTQNALVAAIFGVAAYSAAWNPITAWIFFGTYCTESAYLLIDQVYYKVFLDHIRLGAFESGQQFNLAITLGSFTKEIDWIFYCSATVALLGAAWLARALLSKPSRPVRFRCALAFAGLLALIGLPAYSSKAYGHVNEHAVVELTEEITRQSLVSSLVRPTGPPGHLIASYRSDQPADDDPRLAALLAAGTNRNPRPNVLLIVLESVGAVNLLGADGLPVPEFAPNLSLLARNGIVFNSIYTTFPGTTRSLISLHTGGRQPTYGGLADVAPHYKGPVLAGALEGIGYDTAYFSSERMDGEGTNVFLRQIGFRKYYDFSQDAHRGDSHYQIHSWGSREDYTIGLIEDWIAGRHGDKPFLLEYMTTATHHPYGAPPGYPAPFPPHGRNSDYLNALQYTDHAIGDLVGFLRKRGLLKNTIVAVTGDHGESFGERHAGNLLHKNFTYDENVREFLLFYDGRLVSRNLIDKPVTSSRVGSNGDIMPTLLALLGAPPADVPARNLLTERFESRPVFFHKLASPETWGLRDGRWKYIGEIRTGAAELYDLSVDPAEQKNLASAQPAKVARYRDMSQEWYLQSEREFTLHVNDYTNKMTDSRLIAGDAQMGARALTVGIWHKMLLCTGAPAGGYICRTGLFTQESVANPREPLVAWTKWSLDPDRTARYEWTSPSGKQLVNMPVDSQEWHVTTAAFPGPFPMERGVWSVRLREKNGVRLSTQFSVK